MTRDAILLFDLGGVLIENVGFDALQGLLPHALDQASLKDRWLASAAVRGFELGRLTPDDFATRFLAEWDLDLPEARFLTMFRSWVKGFLPGAEPLLARLRSNHRVCCLSNSNPIHWDMLSGALDHFDAVYASHLLGKIKPDGEIFLAVLRDLGATPDQVYFFDDSPANVRAAHQVGMRAFHAEGVGAVERRLHGEGLLR